MLRHLRKFWFKSSHCRFVSGFNFSLVYIVPRYFFDKRLPACETGGLLRRELLLQYFTFSKLNHILKADCLIGLKYWLSIGINHQKLMFRVIPRTKSICREIRKVQHEYGMYIVHWTVYARSN